MKTQNQKIKPSAEDRKNAKIQKQKQSAKERAEILERKAKVLEKEAVNFDKIIIFEVDNGFWNIVGHSVPMYCMLVVERIGRHQPNIRIDSDHQATKSKEGVITIKDLEQLKSDIKSSDTNFEFKDHLPWLKTIELNTRVTDQQLQDWTKSVDASWKQIEKMVLPSVSWPYLSATSKSIARLVSSVTKKLPRPKQQLGIKMENSAIDSIVSINLAEHGHIPKLDALKSAATEYSKLYAYIDAITADRCANPTTLQELLSEIEKAERLIKKHTREILSEEENLFKKG